MKALVVAAAFWGLAESAFADELADAGRALEAKSYATALQLYQKLAAAGNVEAQFHLGEMYWYGEGVPQDDAQARAWFGKAQAAGSKQAAAALDTMRLHDARRADIQYWIAGYDGAELSAGQYACKAPEFPPMSSSNADIKRLNGAYAEWSACYSAKVTHMNTLMPPGKAIPKDLSDLMNQQEYDAAVAHLDKVYAQVIGAEKARAAVTIGGYEKWSAATDAYVKRTNAEAEAITKKVEYDLRRGQPDMLTPMTVSPAKK
jgi:hypothetical protein